MATLTEPPMTPSRSRGRVGLLALDLVAVGVFAAVGRHSHHEGLDVTGIAGVAAPFAIGTVVGWAVSRGWRRPTTVVPTGVAVWVATVGVGMVLRHVAGGGVEPSFVLVAAIFLGLTQLGWRGLARLRA